MKKQINSLFFFFKASHLLKTVLLKYLCGHFYLEVHFQIQSLLCVGSLLLLSPDAAPPAVSCVPDSPRNTMRDKNLSHDWVREKCRKELCINPTVWGGLVLFWNHTISLLQIPFFFCHCTDTLSGGDASLQRLPIPVHCVTSFQSALRPLDKKKACSGLLSFVFISFFPLCFTLVCLILWMTLNYLCKYLVIERKHFPWTCWECMRVGKKFALEI